MTFPGRKALRAALFLLVALGAGFPVMAQQKGPKDEPWIFVVHDGDTQSDFEKALVDATDEFFADMMVQLSTWEAGLSGEEAFFDWLAEHQRAYDEVKGCYGKPLAKKTMVLSEFTFDRAFDWMLDELGGDAAMKKRPVGPRLKDGVFGASKLPGRANYLTCKKDKVMQTSYTGAGSANRLSVGPATNALTTRMPTFHMAAAHELGHVVQNNLAPGKQKGSKAQRSMLNAHWIIEGAADAVGVLHAQDYHGGLDYFGPYSNKYYRRFFLSRAYNIPLNYPDHFRSTAAAGSPGSTQEGLLDAIDAKTLRLLDYQTNGFWYHIIERYLDGSLKGLNGLYESMTGAAVARSATQVVDRWLDGIDGKSDGLEHVLPQFLAEYASWPAHRFRGKMPESKWLRLSFGGCEEVNLIQGASSGSTTLSVAEYAGKCLRIKVTPQKVRPDAHIRVTGPFEVVEEVYMGWASGSNFKEAPEADDCYERVERYGRRHGVPPCLLVPENGVSNGQLQRYFFLPELTQADVGREVEFLFVLSWVPQALKDARRDFQVRDLTVTVSLDKARIRSGGGEARAATTDYASKKGRAPISAEGEKAPGEASLRDIFTGNFSTMPGLPPQVAGQVREQTEGSVTVRLDPDDDRAAENAVTFFFREEMEPGHKGPLEVFAASVNGEKMGVQNPEKDSVFIVEEYSDEALRFRGTAHVCEGGRAALLSAGKGAEMCEIFPPKSYEVSGAIAFPTVRNSEARLGQPPPSEAHRKYQDLRLSRIEERLGIPGEMTGEPDAPNPPSAPAAGGGGMGFGQKERYADDYDCDCACDSPDRETGDLRCKLLCGKKWKQCPAQ